MTDRMAETFRSVGVVGRDGHDDLQRVVDRLRAFAAERGFDLIFEEGLRDVSVDAVHADLSALGPDFFSVTYGAGGSTRSGTSKTVFLLVDP